MKQAGQISEQLSDEAVLRTTGGAVSGDYFAALCHEEIMTPSLEVLALSAQVESQFLAQNPALV